MSTQTWEQYFANHPEVAAIKEIIRLQKEEKWWSSISTSSMKTTW
jgi:hypothetical protein